MKSIMTVKQKLFLIRVCGENCKICEGNQITIINCIECYPNSSFTEDNHKKCVSHTTFFEEHGNNYYIDDNNIFRQCNPNCATCTGGTTIDPKGEHYHCISCPSSKPFLVTTGDLKDNCYSSCEEPTLYQKEDLYECIIECDSNYIYKYINSN